MHGFAIRGRGLSGCCRRAHAPSARLCLLSRARPGADFMSDALSKAGNTTRAKEPQTLPWKPQKMAIAAKPGRVIAVGPRFRLFPSALHRQPFSPGAGEEYSAALKHTWENPPLLGRRTKLCKAQGILSICAGNWI